MIVIKDRAGAPKPIHVMTRNFSGCAGAVSRMMEYPLTSADADTLQPATADAFRRGELFYKGSEHSVLSLEDRLFDEISEYKTRIVGFSGREVLKDSTLAGRGGRSVTTLIVKIGGDPVWLLASKKVEWIKTKDDLPLFLFNPVGRGASIFSPDTKAKCTRKLRRGARRPPVSLSSLHCYAENQPGRIAPTSASPTSAWTEYHKILAAARRILDPNDSMSITYGTDYAQWDCTLAMPIWGGLWWDRHLFAGMPLWSPRDYLDALRTALDDGAKPSADGYVISGNCRFGSAFDSCNLVMALALSSKNALNPAVPTWIMYKGRRLYYKVFPFYYHNPAYQDHRMMTAILHYEPVTIEFLTGGPKT